MYGTGDNAKFQTCTVEAVIGTPAKWVDAGIVTSLATRLSTQEDKAINIYNGNSEMTLTVLGTYKVINNVASTSTTYASINILVEDVWYCDASVYDNSGVLQYAVAGTPKYVKGKTYRYKRTTNLDGTYNYDWAVTSGLLADMAQASDSKNTIMYQAKVPQTGTPTGYVVSDGDMWIPTVKVQLEYVPRKLDNNGVILYEYTYNDGKIYTYSGTTDTNGTWDDATRYTDDAELTKLIDGTVALSSNAKFGSTGQTLADFVKEQSDKAVNIYSGTVVPPTIEHDITGVDRNKYQIDDRYIYSYGTVAKDGTPIVDKAEYDVVVANGSLVDQANPTTNTNPENEPYYVAKRRKATTAEVADQTVKKYAAPDGTMVINELMWEKVAITSTVKLLEDIDGKRTIYSGANPFTDPGLAATAGQKNDMYVIDASDSLWPATIPPTEYIAVQVDDGDYTDIVYKLAPANNTDSKYKKLDDGSYQQLSIGEVYAGSLYIQTTTTGEYGLITGGEKAIHRYTLLFDKDILYCTTSAITAGANAVYAKVSENKKKLEIHAKHWIGAANSFVTNPDTGAITGWSYVDRNGVDGTGNQSEFVISANNLKIQSASASIGDIPATPFEVYELKDANGAFYNPKQFGSKFNGKVTFSSVDELNAAITDKTKTLLDNTTTIDGGKITTRSVTATKIDTTNLVVQNISDGTATPTFEIKADGTAGEWDLGVGNGVDIYGGSIHGASLTGATIDATSTITTPSITTSTITVPTVSPAGNYCPIMFSKRAIGTADLVTDGSYYTSTITLNGPSASPTGFLSDRVHDSASIIITSTGEAYSVYITAKMLIEVSNDGTTWTQIGVGSAVYGGPFLASIKFRGRLSVSSPVLSGNPINISISITTVVNNV